MAVKASLSQDVTGTIISNFRVPDRCEILCADKFRYVGAHSPTLQKFASVDANVHNHFNLDRHLTDRQTYKTARSAALAEWQNLMA